jgi:hypothetical protein
MMALRIVAMGTSIAFQFSGDRNPVFADDRSYMSWPLSSFVQNR